MNDWLELNLKEHGFYGYFMEGKEHTDKAIICMSGADGKKEFARENGRIHKVGIKGVSMGAQYALLCASLIPKLSLVMCNSDYDNMPQLGVHLIRSKTVGMGYDICDYHFVGDKSD